MEHKNYIQALADGDTQKFKPQTKLKAEELNKLVKFLINNQEALKGAVEILVQKNQKTIQINLDKINLIVQDTKITGDISDFKKGLANG